MRPKMCLYCEEEIYAGDEVIDLPDGRTIHMDCARSIDGEDLLNMMGCYGRIEQEETNVYFRAV